MCTGWRQSPGSVGAGPVSAMDPVPVVWSDCAGGWVGRQMGRTRWTGTGIARTSCEIIGEGEEGASGSVTQRGRRIIIIITRIVMSIPMGGREGVIE